MIQSCTERIYITGPVCMLEIHPGYWEQGLYAFLIQPFGWRSPNITRLAE